jgi:hypothetical protein
MVGLFYTFQSITLTIDIFDYIIVKIIKIKYFKNIHQDDSNNTLYTNIHFYSLIENDGQNNICE